MLSKSINGPELFAPSEDDQVSATEEAPAPVIVHDAPIEVQKVGESDSKTGEVPKRSYASIVRNIHLGCVMSPLCQADVRYLASLPSLFLMPFVFVIMICR